MDEECLACRTAAGDFAAEEVYRDERVVAVVQPKPGTSVGAEEVTAFVKERIGSVKAPKQVEIWADLPRSKIGKVLKPEIRARLL